MKNAAALYFETTRDTRGRWSLSGVRAVRILDRITLGAAGDFAEIDLIARVGEARQPSRVVPASELLSLDALETLSPGSGQTHAAAEKSATLKMAGAAAC